MVKELFKAIRLNNLFILGVIFATIELFFIFKTTAKPIQLNGLLIYLCVLLTSASGYVINDSFDKKSDQLNFKLNKTTLSSKKLTLIAFILAGLSIISSAIDFQRTFFLLNIFVLIGLFLYSWKIKHLPFFGNLLIGIFAGVCPLIAYINHPEIQLLINENTLTNKEINQLNIPFLLGIMAFLTTIAREIIKDIEDCNGDKGVNSKTLPILIGKSASKYFALLFLFSIALCVLCFLLVKENFLLSTLSFLSVITLLLIPILISIIKTIKATNKTDYSKISALIKFIFLSANIVLLIHTFT